MRRHPAEELSEDFLQKLVSLVGKTSMVSVFHEEDPNKVPDEYAPNLDKLRSKGAPVYREDNKMGENAIYKTNKQGVYQVILFSNSGGFGVGFYTCNAKRRA